MLQEQRKFVVFRTKWRDSRWAQLWAVHLETRHVSRLPRQRSTAGHYVALAGQRRTVAAGGIPDITLRSPVVLNTGYLLR